MLDLLAFWATRGCCVLIGELDGPSESDVENAWIAEAKRRHQELIDGRVRGIPGDRVFANVRARLER